MANELTELNFDRDQIDLIKRTVCRGATDDELRLFLYQCRRTGLDPLSRQIYAIQRWNPQSNRNEMVMQVAIDGFRLIANRTGEYAGQLGPWWCGKDGQWRDIWVNGDMPEAAKVGVLRRTFTEPLFRVAKFQTYAQRKKDGNLTRNWLHMPDLMVAKCAEALALRTAFPQELSGIYVHEEMQQAGPSELDDPEPKEQTYANRRNPPEETTDWRARKFDEPKQNGGGGSKSDEPF